MAPELRVDEVLEFEAFFGVAGLMDGHGHIAAGARRAAVEIAVRAFLLALDALLASTVAGLADGVAAQAAGVVLAEVAIDFQHAEKLMAV
jgi:hypothetical protein